MEIQVGCCVESWSKRTKTKFSLGCYNKAIRILVCESPPVHSSCLLTLNRREITKVCHIIAYCYQSNSSRLRSRQLIQFISDEDTGRKNLRSWRCLFPQNLVLHHLLPDSASNRQACNNPHISEIYNQKGSSTLQNLSLISVL